MNSIVRNALALDELLALLKIGRSSFDAVISPANERYKPPVPETEVTHVRCPSALTADVANRQGKATPPTMPKFTHHIFVCCNRREPGHSRGCCDPDGSENLRNLFKSEVKRRGLNPLVRANKAGCLDQCECGPTVVIYPQEIWYGGVKPEDVPRIVEETVVHGRVIEELLISDECLNTKGGQTGAAAASSTSQEKAS